MRETEGVYNYDKKDKKKNIFEKFDLLNIMPPIWVWDNFITFAFVCIVNDKNSPGYIFDTTNS